MFDRFLLYARARRALKHGQFDGVLRLIAEPGIRGERRAEQLREKALWGIMRRARRRLGEGNFDAARTDVERVISIMPEFDGAATLEAEIGAEVERRDGTARAASEMRREAKHLAERGDLRGAERLCQQAGEGQAAGPEQAAVERFIEGRQRAAEDDLEGARSAVERGDQVQLRRHLARLRAQADVPAEVAEIAAHAARLMAQGFVDRLREDTEDRRGLLDEIARERSGVPELLEDSALDAGLRRLGEESHAAVRRQLVAGDLSHAVAVFQGTHALIRDREPLLRLRPGIVALAEGVEARARGELGRALETMRVAAAHLDGKGVKLESIVNELAAAEGVATAALGRSRELAAEGRLLAAREHLVPLLESWPMHEPVRRQMEILDQQAEDREARLQRARALANDARLAEASALLLGLSSEREEGREARLLLADINTRMDLAAQGLAQVRRAVHGQASASREGLRHCAARLDEVAKLQSDLEEAHALKAALQAEMGGLDRLEALDRALETGDVAVASQAMAGFEVVRNEMLRPDRLDARFLDLADRILVRVDSGVHNGRLLEATAWMGVVQGVASDHPGLASRIGDLNSAIASNQERALGLIARLEEPDASRTLDDPGELLDEVRGIWADCPQLHKVESRLLSLQCHASAVDEIERLAGQGDVRGANQKLGEMPPTPGFLRTRIFDIKQGLARAQGLDQGFVLRVDEGGEYLVLRDDSVTFGNVRDGKADILLLANIAGVHARLKRTLSFHGGMEDRIVAEKGEVRVNGHRVDTAVLRSEDRVCLGDVLEFIYRLPSKRSLTAALYLKSGFQVAGTDKILLLKDRGRDGRILIGRADDAHIRVPHDETEVEIYSASDGQIRARFGGKGDMDGRPFSGEHPVTAGALVRCGETGFVLQPWNRQA